MWSYMTMRMSWMALSDSTESLESLVEGLGGMEVGQ